MKHESDVVAVAAAAVDPADQPAVKVIVRLVGATVEAARRQLNLTDDEMLRAFVEQLVLVGYELGDGHPFIPGLAAAYHHLRDLVIVGDLNAQFPPSDPKPLP